MSMYADSQCVSVCCVALLEKISASLSSVKDKKVFLINNYDQILSVFQERHVSSEEVQRMTQ